MQCDSVANSSTLLVPVDAISDTSAAAEGLLAAVWDTDTLKVSSLESSGVPLSMLQPLFGLSLHLQDKAFKTRKELLVLLNVSPTFRAVSRKFILPRSLFLPSCVLCRA
jgi:hypothetical protein